MDSSAKKVFELMFRPGETVCVSHNKYGYHSIPLENAINGPVTLVPPNINGEYSYPKTEELILVALNPIKGFRQDINCTAFRSFLVEMDYGPIPQQMEYVKKMGMPYSAAIFSGNKSIHFLITLQEDFPSEFLYRFFSEWILGSMTLADQNTKNPSRSIRIPGAYREPGKRQELMEYRGAITKEELVAWLKRFPDAKPKEKQKNIISENPEFIKIKDWVTKALVDGIHTNRNKTWFVVGVEFALAGYGEDDTLDKLRPYYHSYRDFKEKEWETTIRSAFKWAYQRKQ